jgi:hypothetical protein
MSRIRGLHIAFAAGIIVVGGALAAGIVALADTTTHHTALITDVSTSAASVEQAAPQSADDRMNDFLTAHGNPPEQQSRMRDVAREVCRSLGTSANYNEQVMLLESRANMAPDAAKVFLSGAIDIYCPAYEELVPR